MTTIQRNHPPREQANIFGAPWNESASKAAKVRTTVAFVVLLALVILFASTASGWISSLVTETTRPVADAPKANPDRSARSTVPVLAPSGMTAAQADEFAEHLRITPDGYFSSVSYGDFDIVVDASLPRAASADSPIRVSETERGLAVMFSRGGGAYQVEIVCRGPGSEQGVSCIAEDEAVALVAAFVAFDPATP